LFALLEFVGGHYEYVMVTIDKSWFHLFYSHDHIWLTPGEEPPVRPKHTLEDRKVMVTIGFGVANVHVVLPKGQKFSAMYYCDVILRRVLDSGLKTGGSSSSFMPTMAGRRQPTWSEISLKRMGSSALHIHPTHRIWHLAIFIFSDILNYDRWGTNFCQSRIYSWPFKKILDEITVAVLVRVFADWEGRLRLIIANNGECYRRGS
jgi:hypothetical protein